MHCTIQKCEVTLIAGVMIVAFLSGNCLQICIRLLYYGYFVQGIIKLYKVSHVYGGSVWLLVFLLVICAHCYC
jgi:hypothetical protein